MATSNASNRTEEAWETADPIGTVGSTLGGSDLLGWGKFSEQLASVAKVATVAGVVGVVSLVGLVAYSGLPQQGITEIGRIQRDTFKALFSVIPKIG